jgi:hypothetical protein
MNFCYGEAEMERGWLRRILEQARADRETWPAWQRGAGIGEGGSETKIAEPEGREEDSAGHERAA